MVGQDGSAVAAELWSTGYPVASSILSYPEGRSALAAARRKGRLTSSAHGCALADFEDTHRELLLVGIDHALARRAGELAEDFDLRGYDAVHLASALALDVDGITVVTWDRHLNRAAAHAGCAVAPVL